MRKFDRGREAEGDGGSAGDRGTGRRGSARRWAPALEQGGSRGLSWGGHEDIFVGATKNR